MLVCPSLSLAPFLPTPWSQHLGYTASDMKTLFEFADADCEGFWGLGFRDHRLEFRVRALGFVLWFRVSALGE